MAHTHALVIGVSHYDELPGPEDDGEPSTFGLRSLQSAATSAAHFARWLVAEYNMPDAPLAQDLRLLLSPSAGERTRLTAGENTVPPATYACVREAIDAWHEDCFNDPAGVAILYAAGHGVWKNPLSSGTLLLQDFAADRKRIMENALDIPTVHGAMGAVAGPARQFYFLDACRNHTDVPGELLAEPGLPGWTAPIRHHARTAPIYFSAAADTTSYGIPNGSTVFSEALLEALRWDAIDLGDDGDWIVKDHDLGPPIIQRVADIAEQRGAEQAADTGGRFGGLPFHICLNPPEVPIALSVAPPGASAAARCSLILGQQEIVSKHPSPVKRNVPAGNYLLRVTIDPPDRRFKDFDDSWLIRPAKSAQREVEVSA